MLAPQVPQREPNLPAAAAPPVQTIKSDFPDRTLSGLGGVNTGRDAAEFILLGSHTVQARPGRCEATCALHLPFSGQTGFCQQGRRSPAVGCFVHICEAQRCRQQQALMASACGSCPAPAGVHRRDAVRLPNGQEAVRRPAGKPGGPFAPHRTCCPCALCPVSRHWCPLSLAAGQHGTAPGPPPCPPPPSFRPLWSSTTLRRWKTSAAPRCRTSPPTTSWCAPAPAT